MRLDPTSEANSHALEEAYVVKWNQRDAQVHKQVQVIEDLQLREQPDPRARNILGAPPKDKMPKGSQVAVIDTCLTWWGFGPRLAGCRQHLVPGAPRGPPRLGERVLSRGPG